MGLSAAITRSGHPGEYAKIIAENFSIYYEPGFHGREMKTALFILISLSYIASCIAYFLYVATRKEAFLLSGKKILLSGFILQSVYLALQALALKHAPVASLIEGFSFVGWTLVLLYFLLLFRYRINALGGLTSFLGLIFWFLPLFLKGTVTPDHKIVLNLWLYLHAAFIFLSYSVFAIAFISGILYLVEERALKAHNSKMPFAILPSLEDFDSINYRMILLGFPLLTIGIVMGAVWAKEKTGSFSMTDPKVLWSLLTWLIYAASLHLRLTKGFCGRKLAMLCVAGFGFLLFTFIGVGLAFRSFHLF